MPRRIATVAVCTLLTATPQFNPHPDETYVAASERFTGPIVPETERARLLKVSDEPEYATIDFVPAFKRAPVRAPEEPELSDGPAMPRNQSLAPLAPVTELAQTASTWVEASIGAAADARLLHENISPPPPEISRDTTCFLLKEVAAENHLPEPLFARLIWQESRFRPDAVSPVGAQGIAQFMPATAAERGLEDPFDPIQALPASGAFLRDLMFQFGNFGLAAAAYNGGPGRVGRWLKGQGGLPAETRNYVIQITGRTAEHWAKNLIDAGPHPEALEVNDCNPQPLRTALAEAREEERMRKNGYPSVALANAAAQRREDGTPMPPKRQQSLPWMAVLAGNWSEQKARAVYADLRKKHPKILGHRSPTVRVTRAGGKGKKSAPKATVGVAAATRAEAQELCKRMKGAGDACVVKKDPAA